MQIAAVLLVSGFIASALAADGKLARIPRCNCDGLQCECCSTFRFRKEPKTACLRIDYNVNELILNAELSMNGMVIGSRTISPNNFVPFCVPAPPLNVCMNARRVFLSRDQAKVCAGLDVKLITSSIFKARLPCLNMVGGQFTVTRN